MRMIYEISIARCDLSVDQSSQIHRMPGSGLSHSRIQ